MIKLDLNTIAEEFEFINDETRLLYNKETGEHEFYFEHMCEDPDKYESDEWIYAPSKWDFDKFNMMVEFADSQSDRRTRETLNSVLGGKGSFRRFDDALHRVGLTSKWHEFKHKAYVEVAREWCDKHGIDYIGKADYEKSQREDDNNPLDDVAIVPLSEKMIDVAVEIMCKVLNYKESKARESVKRMLSKKRIALAALVSDAQNGQLALAGIIGAIPQYGVTGWELHPLAVLPAYQKRGIGSFLLETVECEVIARGGVMMYLGSDDETGTTSLFGVDLYNDTFEKIENIKNVGGHPFPFYEKHGYKIVGVLPDANGIGKPDIWMAKRL